MGFSYDAIEDLKVAISEATTNVVAHAYDNEDNGELNLGFGVYKNKLEIMISDQGESFRLDEIKSRIGPVSPKEELKPADRKSTRLNSSHVAISYAVFCLKKKK